MATCDRCGAPLTPGDHYCRACGALVARPGRSGPQAGPRPDWRPPAQVLPAPPPYGPPPRPPRPPRRGPRPALVAGAVLAVLATGGAAAGMILRSTDRPAPSALTAAPTVAPLPLPTSVPVVAPTPSAEPTAPADPEALLREQLDADTATVESLVGKWIPQLSSKREGDVVDGTTYDAAAILDEFTSWKDQVPSSVLTRSERFTSFRATDYWVVLAAEPFDTAEAANAWCDAQGIAPGDCFAKRLSYTEGPGGNTRPR